MRQLHAFSCQLSSSDSLVVKGNYAKRLKKSLRIFGNELEVINLKLVKKSNSFTYFGHDGPRDLEVGVSSIKATTQPSFTLGLLVEVEIKHFS